MKSELGCPFCSIKDCDIIEEGKHWKVMLDKFPVSKGHSLVISKRHVETWFDLATHEQSELNYMIDRRQFEMNKVFQPDGYNVGFNAGEAAGQTIFHCHIHVIPRYRKDVFDPAGGIRGVIPMHKNYIKTPILEVHDGIV